MDYLLCARYFIPICMVVYTKMFTHRHGGLLFRDDTIQYERGQTQTCPQ